MTAAIEDLWLFASSVLLIVDDVLCCKVLLVRYHRLPLQFFLLLFIEFSYLLSLLCFLLACISYLFSSSSHSHINYSYCRNHFPSIVSIVSSTQCRSVLLTILSIHCSSPWLDFLLSCCFSHYVILTLVFVLHMLCPFFCFVSLASSSYFLLTCLIYSFCNLPTLSWCWFSLFRCCSQQSL